MRSLLRRFRDRIQNLIRRLDRRRIVRKVEELELIKFFTDLFLTTIPFYRELTRFQSIGAH